MGKLAAWLYEAVIAKNPPSEQMLSHTQALRRFFFWLTRELLLSLEHIASCGRISPHSELPHNFYVNFNTSNQGFLAKLDERKSTNLYFSEEGVIGQELYIKYHLLKNVFCRFFLAYAKPPMPAQGPSHTFSDLCTLHYYWHVSSIWVFKNKAAATFS